MKNLPTFYKWGMKLLGYKRAIIIALLVFGGFKVLNISLERYFSVIQTCDQPCQDATSCDPLELNIEISPATIKLGRPYFVWYHARLKNRSCRRLEGVSVDGFIDSKDLTKEGSHLWVSVTGPDGHEVKRLPIPGPDGGISWDYGSTKGVSVSTEGEIYPYQPNLERIEKLWQSDEIGGKWKFIGLAPGETLGTVTPILRPYRIIATSVRGEDGGMGHGYRWLAVENPPKFPTPPDGFNLLDRYLFDRPGQYTMRAGFIGQVFIYPVFSRWDKLPPVLKWVLGTKPIGRHEPLKVNLVAPPAHIEVIR